MEKNILVGVLGFLFVLVLVITLGGGQDVIILGAESEFPENTTISYSNSSFIEEVLDTFSDKTKLTSITYNNDSLISFVSINDSSSGITNLTFTYNDSLLTEVSYD